METKRENLRELIEKFMDPQNAQTYLDDIEAGESILRKYPAPKPDDMLLANIKANITLHKVPQKTVTFRKRVYEALAVAASIMVIAAISLQSIHETPTLPRDPHINKTAVVPDGWWTLEDKGHTDIINTIKDINSQIDNIDTPTEDDETFVFAEFENQIKQLENKLYNIENEDNNYNSTSVIDDIENRLNQIKNNDNFWESDYSNSGAFEI